jgi:hypothetical protein
VKGTVKNSFNLSMQDEEISKTPPKEPQMEEGETGK